MDDLSARLNDFLSSPGAMDQLSSMMSSLGMNGLPGSAESAQDPGDAQPPPHQSQGQGPGGFDFGGLDMDMIFKIKQAYDQMNSQNQDDPKVALLLALKPYMGEKRKPHIDTAIKFSQLSKLTALSGLFQSMF